MTFVSCLAKNLVNHTTRKENVTNLEKKLFTVSVYAHGLTGPVRVKFDQMVHCLILYQNFYAYAIYRKADVMVLSNNECEIELGHPIDRSLFCGIFEDYATKLTDATTAVCK